MFIGNDHNALDMRFRLSYRVKYECLVELTMEEKTSEAVQLIILNGFARFLGAVGAALLD